MAKTDQRAAGYLPPSQAPFRCGSCEYFSAPSACRLVEGRIEAEGCCNLFSKDEGSDWDGDEHAERE